MNNSSRTEHRPSHTLEILALQEPNTFKEVQMKDVPREEHLTCLCCGTTLIIVCIIASDDTSDIRIGQCPICDYIGFIDRPTKQWVENFYDTTWDVATKQELSEIRDPKTEHPITEKVLSFNVPKTARIFDIGAGYGNMLKRFYKLGFTNLYGIDNSPHRAERASQFAHAHVIHGAFGDGDSQKRLQEHGPFSVMYSKSVMEHMYDPNSLFTSAAKLQNERDHLIVLVPDIFEEPTYDTLLFLPHLHGFTKRTLEALALKHGYIPKETYNVGKGLYLIAEKSGKDTKEHMHTLLQKKTETQAIGNKWVRELQLDKITPSSKRRYYWATTDDYKRTGVIPSRASGAMYLLTYIFVSLLYQLPLQLSQFPLRLFFGVAKKHVAFVVRPYSTEKAQEVGILYLYMKKCKLLYK